MILQALVLLALSATAYGLEGFETQQAKGDQAKKQDSEPAPPLPPKGKSPSITSPPPAELDTLLLTAMEQNPDIRVAQSKLREAEAELNRTRLQVARQIVTLRESILNQRREIERLHVLFYDLMKIQFTELGEALTALAAMEAELAYTLGETAIGRKESK
jgi:hypothetical protein